MFALFATAIDPSADLGGFLQLIEGAIQGRNWILLAALGVVGAVALLRKFAPPFFKTRLGGWLLNFLTVGVGIIATALTTGTPFGWGMLAAALGTAATTAGLKELLFDLADFAKAKGWFGAAPIPPPVDVSGAVPPGATVKYIGKGEQ